MKVEQDGTRTLISEGRFLPRFVRYFAVSSIVCGIALLACGLILMFTVEQPLFQTVIAFLLSLAAICYGVYLMFLFPDVKVTIDKKTARVGIVTKRLWDKTVRELETRRITSLLIERSEAASGKDIFRIVLKTYKGEAIPLSGSWTEHYESVHAEAKKILGSLDPGCALETPRHLAAKQPPAPTSAPQRTPTPPGSPLSEK